MSNNCCVKGSIVDVNCTHEEGRFVFCSLPGCLPSLFTARFIAPADYTAGDVVMVKGKELPVRTPGMSAATSDIFKAGAIIHCDIDLDRELAFFWLGSGSGVALPNLSYEEQFAGFYDVDGSKVYCKTIEIGTLASSSHTTPHNIPGFKAFIDAKFRRWNSGGAGSGGEGNYTTTKYLTYVVTPTSVIVETNQGASWQSLDHRITLYYTCTDR